MNPRFLISTSVPALLAGIALTACGDSTQKTVAPVAQVPQYPPVSQVEVVACVNGVKGGNSPTSGQQCSQRTFYLWGAPSEIKARALQSGPVLFYNGQYDYDVFAQSGGCFNPTQPQPQAAGWYRLKMPLVVRESRDVQLNLTPKLVDNAQVDSWITGKTQPPPDTAIALDCTVVDITKVEAFEQQTKAEQAAAIERKRARQNRY
jgi:hypothetical protein